MHYTVPLGYLHKCLWVVCIKAHMARRYVLLALFFCLPEPRPLAPPTFQVDQAKEELIKRRQNHRRKPGEPRLVPELLYTQPIFAHGSRYYTHVLLYVTSALKIISWIQKVLVYTCIYYIHTLDAIVFQFNLKLYVISRYMYFVAYCTRIMVQLVTSSSTEKMNIVAIPC